MVTKHHLGDDESRTRVLTYSPFILMGLRMVLGSHHLLKACFQEETNRAWHQPTTKLSSPPISGNNTLTTNQPTIPGQAGFMTAGSQTKQILCLPYPEPVPTSLSLKGVTLLPLEHASPVIQACVRLQLAGAAA